METKPVFIGGVGRCGTNLMRIILDAHKKVFSPPFEIRIFIDPDGVLDFYHTIKHSWNPINAQVAFERLQRLLTQTESLSDFGTPYENWQLRYIFDDYRKKTHKFLSELSEFIFPGYWSRMGRSGHIPYVGPDIERVRKICRKYMLSLMGEAEFYVDDGTYNLFYIEEFNEILPEAKFIWLTRRTDQIVGSMGDEFWCPTHINDLTIWVADCESVLSSRIFKFPHLKNVIMVKHDDLINDRMKVMQEVCLLIDLEPDELFFTNIQEMDFSKANEYTFKSDIGDKIKELLEIRRGDR